MPLAHHVRWWHAAEPGLIHPMDSYGGFWRLAVAARDAGHVHPMLLQAAAGHLPHVPGNVRPGLFDNALTNSLTPRVPFTPINLSFLTLASLRTAFTFAPHSPSLRMRRSCLPLPLPKRSR